MQDTPPASFDQCLEAENASGPGSTPSDAGASGQKYKWSYNSANDYNTYTVTGVTNSNINYYLKLRYATGEAPSAGVLVNGVLQPNLFPLINTASWSGTYGELEYPYPITLNTGNNTITIRGSSTGTFTQDRICVSSTSTSNSCFNVTASTSNGNPSGGGAITLTANCTGTCSGVSYAWNGPNGYNATGSPVTTNAPTAAAIYNYTLTASKSGCATKTIYGTSNSRNTTYLYSMYGGRKCYWCR